MEQKKNQQNYVINQGKRLPFAIREKVTKKRGQMKEDELFLIRKSSLKKKHLPPFILFCEAIVGRKIPPRLTGASGSESLCK